MCILFIALGQHPQYPLIIAANRDEDFARPSRTAHYWEDAPSIYGGRDLQAGGSWLAVSTQGRLAAITNLRMPELYKDKAEARSRGELIQKYLQCEDESAFKNEMSDQRNLYNPFNLLFGSFDQLSVYNSAKDNITVLDKGFHSISNGPIDDYWPKMSRGVSLLETHVSDSKNQALDTQRLFADMRDSAQADDTLLPHTGVGIDIEKHLSSIFISGDVYGTRTTSLLSYDGKVLEFHEQDYAPMAVPTSLQTETISIVG